MFSTELGTSMCWALYKYTESP